MAVSAELKRELGGEVKDLDRLDAAAQKKLVDLLRAAHKRQRADLDTALNQVFEHIPLLLRGAAKKIFFHE